MSDSIVSGLLQGVGIGDVELVDPRDGDHESSIKEVRLAENSPTAANRYALVITHTGMTDAEGRDFELDNRITLPTSEAKDVILRMFQSTLHTLGLVSYDDKRPYFADSEAQRESFLAAFKTLEGVRLPISVKNKDGFPRISYRRPKK